MPSWQEKIKRVEEAARFAAQEIKEAREADDQTEQQNQQQQQQSTGVLGKLQEGTASLLKATTDAITGKSHGVAKKAKEGTEAASEMIGEDKDYAVVEKAGENKDYAAEKAEEAKDVASEKTMEGKEAATGRLMEFRDSAAEAAGKVRDCLLAKKEDIKERAMTGTGDAPKEIHAETEPEARKKMEELRFKELREQGVEPEDEAAESAKADEDAAAERGRAATANILRGLGSVSEAIRCKLTMPSDIVEETLAERGRGGAGRGVDEEVDVNSEISPAGVVDSIKLKVADQFSRTSDDVNKFGGQGKK
ncbi:hypothetical protein Ancab_031747 [Ancistrocladus abbreviatus]